MNSFCNSVFVIVMQIKLVVVVAVRATVIQVIIYIDYLILLRQIPLV